MTTYIKRPKEGTTHAFDLNDDQRRRVKEHLLSVGYDVARIPKLIWPENSVSATQDYMYAPYQFTYKSDVRRAKIERMNQSLWRKRERGKIEKRYLYVWVFWCPGISGIFKGLWAYIVGSGKRYHGGGHKGDLQGRLLCRVRGMFPVDNPHPLFDLDEKEWMAQFIMKYRRGQWCGKPQGKAPFLAEVQNGHIKKIIKVAQWPGTIGNL